MTDRTDDTHDGVPPASHFYRAVWRWHFYAGLFVVPFMVVLSLSGIVYLFKPQLDALMYRDRMFVVPGATAISAQEQVDAVLRAYPGARPKTFAPLPAADRSSEVDVATEDGRDLKVFVDPYSGRVLGHVDNENNLQALAFKVHGSLLIGTAGEYLVELAACWGLVLVVSGLYLWLPRRGFGVWGTIVPRLRLRNRRLFWRDAHAVTGFYGALIVVFMILTGLPWAEFWGSTFARVWDRYPPGIYEGIPTSRPLTGSLNDSGSGKIVPWAVERMPLPVSDDPARHQHHGVGPTGDAPASAGPVSLDDVVVLGREEIPASRFLVSLPRDETGVYTVTALPTDPAAERTFHVDQYSGRILADVRWRDYGVVPKAVELGIALHQGTYFGWLNQILMLCSALVVIVLAVSGGVMWWRRRPARRLGAPPLPENFPLWKGAVAVVVVMGVAFPLVGISLAAVLLFDYAVLSRVPRLREVLG